MKADKLKEALDELKLERDAINKAIIALEGIIQNINGAFNVSRPIGIREARETTARIHGSYIDLAVAVIEKHGRPVQIKDLTRDASNMKGEPIERRSFEASLFKHIQKSPKPRLVKVSPGYYGLPSWPAEA
jgi:hypothetical protein